MKIDPVTMVQLAPVAWERYQSIRLEALKTEPTAFANSYENVAGDTEAQWRERLEKSSRKDGQILLFAQHGTDIIGMAGGIWDPREKIRHVGRVFGTFVRLPYRGQGVGRLLMNAIIQELKLLPHIRKIRIEVTATNAPALHLYQQVGFRFIGTAERELFVNGAYYDEILLEMKIDRP